ISRWLSFCQLRSCVVHSNGFRSRRRLLPNKAFLICLGIVLTCVGLPPAQPVSAQETTENGYSTLTEITSANVGQLKLAWSFRTGAPGSHTSSPLPLADRLLVLTPFPHTLFALDLTRPGAPVAWRYTPSANGTAEGLSCCGGPTGGIAADAGRVFLNTLDGHVVALDSTDGHVIWGSPAAHPEAGEILTTPPLPVRNELVLGTSGDDSGARGSLIALDAATGQRRWQVFSTGPDKEVGIGPDYHADGGDNLGITTWPPSAWQQGGGGLAGPLVFDPEAGLLFQQTGHPAPWNPDQRDGDNRWTAGLFARDPESGNAVWFDAINPHDPFSLGAGGGIVLGNLRDRPVLIHPDSSGYLYVVDRATGKVVSASPYKPVTATRGVDLATGQVIRNPDYTPQRGSTVRDICPAWPAGSNALPAISPPMGFVYLPVAQLCMDMETVATGYMAGTLFTGANVRMKPAAGQTAGALIAWDLSADRPVWRIGEELPLRGGALATAGGLVFYGTLDGAFKAADARTGQVLWSFRAASGIVARPVTFQAPDGHQFVVVLAGSGGLTGTESAREIDARDNTAAHGLAFALGPLPAPADPSGVLYAFRLP
ncbi:MAG: PQQ-binding-like beta-propeller repeat protein, partial [Rhodopila sp.]